MKEFISFVFQGFFAFGLAFVFVLSVAELNANFNYYISKRKKNK